MPVPILIIAIISFIAFLLNKNKRREAVNRRRRSGGGLPWLGSSRRREKDYWD